MHAILALKHAQQIFLLTIAAPKKKCFPHVLKSGCSLNTLQLGKNEYARSHQIYATYIMQSIFFLWIDNYFTLKKWIANVGSKHPDGHPLS